MPYANMPENLWPKMDACVSDLQAQGHDKDTAIAICYTSIMGARQIQQQASADPLQLLANPLQLLWKGIAGLLHITETTDPTAERQKQSPAYTIIRQSDGKLRWMGVAATSVINHDGMIDSTKLFDSFIQRIEQTNKYPLYDVMHLGEQCVIGQADFVVRDGAAYFASGTFNEDEFSQAAARTLQEDPEYWGHSIAFVTGDPNELDVNGVAVPVFVEGENQYISVVPRSRAASLFTDVAVQQRSKRMTMTEEQFQALVKLVGPELAAQKREQLSQLNRMIEEAGLVQRQAQAQSTPVVVPVEAASQADAVQAAATSPAVASAALPAEPQTTPSADAQPTAEQAPEQERAEPTMADVMAAVTAMADKMQSMIDMLAGAQQEVSQLGTRLQTLEIPVEQRVSQALEDAPAAPSQTIARPSILRAKEGTSSIDPSDTLAALGAQRVRR